MPNYDIVLDPNERQRLLAEGYLPEVIEWTAAQRYQKMQEDFLRKNHILGRYYADTPYFEFVADVFPDLENLMVITGDTTYSEMSIDELMEYHCQRSDVYVTPASFINGCYSAVCCKDLYAFVVDIDRIDPDVLKNIIDNGTLGIRVPMPTYIVNSGSGVHFYYVFEEPVPHYKRNQPILKSMYAKLCGITRSNIAAKTDWHAITQPFRLPGTMTKLDQTVTGWRCGDKWKAAALAKRLLVDATELELKRRPLLPQREFLEEKASREAQPEPATPKKKRKKREIEWVSSLDGNTMFYKSCLQRCYDRTPEGTRYRSMMALTVVARKCGYPKEDLEKDLMELLAHYNQTGGYMKPSEVKKAMRMYNDKALKTRSRTLELWFGWDFPRLNEKIREKQQAKGKPIRTKAEVWERARKIRDMDYPDGEWRNTTGAPSKKMEILKWRWLNPEGTPRECMEATGISKNTVYKWWNSQPVGGITDGRTDDN